MPLFRDCVYCNADRDSEHAKACVMRIPPPERRALRPAWIAGYEKKPFTPDTLEEQKTYEMGRTCLADLDAFFADA
jgi:hypothetical protein